MEQENNTKFSLKLKKLYLNIVEVTGVKTGAGILIGEDLVLTCAYLVYDKKWGTKADADKMRVTFNGNRKRYVKDYRFPKEYLSPRTKNRREYDFALLRLSTEIIGLNTLELMKDFRSHKPMQLPTLRDATTTNNYQYK